MDWYLMVWRRYADFDGRSRRTEYWMFALFNFLAAIVLGGIGGIGTAFIDNGSGAGAVLFIPLGLYMLAGIIPGLAVAVRRLHDTGKSGWLLLLFAVIGIIPFIGFIGGVIQIVIMCLDSDPGVNQYGPNPKFPEQTAGIYAGNAGMNSMGFGSMPLTPVGETHIRLCKNCGAQTNAASQFCSNCGMYA